MLSSYELSSDICIVFTNLLPNQGKPAEIIYTFSGFSTNVIGNRLLSSITVALKNWTYIN